ncbi:hypothetical protein JMJ77_0005141 [Colletotrichum scovillei]|uniref:Uncharacterized protein n=1 Tax=Colletotrichum scovillei TaxID=1209932 RepID=A0A9P7UH77_9PEZI|nr:hypothetical protein JMJ77_0005141 [Colletotrichum scovillei]KAG7076354.1 hypothetical protein JMJ76_0013619 [Colletotrichum scovillei]KAG7083406.1 hypothetical protein JMJ78_0008852 [Colletotrichum scovillei]
MTGQSVQMFSPVTITGHRGPRKAGTWHGIAASHGICDSVLAHRGQSFFFVQLHRENVVATTFPPLPIRRVWSKRSRKRTSFVR